MGAATKKEKKRRSLPLEGRYITNLKQSILETFDIYDSSASMDQNTEICKQWLENPKLPFAETSVANCI
jgi:hypothetical protein